MYCVSKLAMDIFLWGVKLRVLLRLDCCGFRGCPFAKMEFPGRGVRSFELAALQVEIASQKLVTPRHSNEERLKALRHLAAVGWSKKTRRQVA